MSLYNDVLWLPIIPFLLSELFVTFYYRCICLFPIHEYGVPDIWGRISIKYYYLHGIFQLSSRCSLDTGGRHRYVISITYLCLLDFKITFLIPRKKS